MNTYTLESYISILLGFFAIVIPIISLIFCKRLSKTHYLKSILSFISMLCCSASITVQVWSIRQCILVRDDLSAVLDTINVLSLVCIALLGITTLLNALYIICTRKSK